MNKNEKIIKKLAKIFLFVVVVLLILVIMADYFNIGKYFPFNHLTTKYDWFGIIGAIIGGLIGAFGTYIGIYVSIRNEKEDNKRKEIEERKRMGYSYLTFSDNPVAIKLSLDSVSTGLLDQNQNILIGENVKIVGAHFFDIELDFININNNYPTAVMIDNLDILYDSVIKDNTKLYNKSLNLIGYRKKYCPITIKKNNILAFQCKSFINDKQLLDLEKYLLNSEFIDIITTIKFINANGIVTTGRFSANLVKDKITKIGNKKTIGSNKEKIEYSAENTYLIIKKVDFIDNYGDEIFGEGMEVNDG